MYKLKGKDIHFQVTGPRYWKSVLLKLESNSQGRLVVRCSPRNCSTIGFLQACHKSAGNKVDKDYLPRYLDAEEIELIELKEYKLESKLSEFITCYSLNNNSFSKYYILFNRLIAYHLQQSINKTFSYRCVSNLFENYTCLELAVSTSA